MTSPFQTELRDRAATHAREWEAAHDPSVGLVDVTASVRRRRRGRALLAVAGGAGCLALVASVAYVALGRGPDAGPAGPGGENSALAELAAVGVDDVVLTVHLPVPGNTGATSPGSIHILDPIERTNTMLSYPLVLEALGEEVEAWPDVRLVAVDTSLKRAIFQLDNPLAYVTPHVAILNLASGDVLVVDPCTSPLSSINLSTWCSPDPLSAEEGVIDPATGEFVAVPGYYDCVSAAARYGDLIAASCGTEAGESFLVTLDPASGDVVAKAPLGLAPVQAPLLLGGEVFANASTTEGDLVMVDASGNGIDVGGAPAELLAVVEDRLLIQAGSDRYGGDSLYGHALGLWSPATDEFTTLVDAEAWRDGYIRVVDLLP